MDEIAKNIADKLITDKGHSAAQKVHFAHNKYFYLYFTCNGVI